MFDLKNLMRQAKNMQDNVKRVQEEIKNMTFEGDVSNGMVKNSYKWNKRSYIG